MSHDPLPASASPPPAPDTLEQDLARTFAAGGTARRAAGATPDRFLAGVRRRRWQRRARLAALPALALSGALVVLAWPQGLRTDASPHAPNRPTLAAAVPFPPTATMGSGLVASLIPRAGESMTSPIGKELLRPD